MMVSRDGPGIDLDLWRRRCLEWQERDLEEALARFTFIADVTVLATECRFAGDEDMLVVRYEGLPFAAIAFHGDEPARLAAWARQLLEPGEAAWCLVGEEQWPIVQAAFQVLEVHQEWQMICRGRPVALSHNDVVALGPPDLPEMAALARREGMMAFEHEPLARGPWYGVRCDGTLVAQGGTHLILDRAAEIGNIVTAQTHRRRGYGSQVVAALVRTLQVQGKEVFLQVFKDNAPAISCYERLGFEPLRTMYLVKIGGW